MFKNLFRILLTLIIVGILIILFAPRAFSNSANSLISSSTSQIQGMAQFIPAQALSSLSNKGELQVSLTGLVPNTMYDLHLDQGQCGGTSTDLGSAKSDGNGGYYAELPMNSLDPKQTWYIDVLQQGVSVACNVLQTDQDSSSQVINTGPNVFGPQTPSSQPAQGSGSTPTPETSSSQQNTTSSTLPNMPVTGSNPGKGQQYDNNQYPRKY